MLYVCDRASTAPLAETRIIAIRRSDQTFVSQVAAPCSAARFAADRDYVYGADDTTVYRFLGPTLTAAGQYGQDGTGRGGFGRIDAVAASGGTVYAIDGALARVARFSGITFNGSGWKTVSGPGRTAAGRTVAGVDAGSLVVAIEATGGVKVSRIAATLAGAWRSRALASGGRVVTDVGGLDVDAGRVYITTQAVGGRKVVSVLMLDATSLASVGIGVNRSGAPAKLVAPNGVAVAKAGLYVADGGTAAAALLGRPSGSITVWSVTAAR
jgi:hypothetical protein